MNATRSLSLLFLAVGLTTATGVAQPAPPGIALPVREPNPALVLRMAYRTIGAAEARGAGGRFLDAARTHYRAALGRAASSPPAAAHEAGAAAALARAALDERPLPVPRDLPPPPPLPALPAGRPGPFGPHGPVRFDPEALARDAALENTPEATDVAKAALEAEVAGERAAFAGNHDEGMRQHRLARDLAAAVRELARADHPPAQPQRRRMPLSLGAPVLGDVEVGEEDALRPAQPAR